MLYEVALWKL